MDDNGVNLWALLNRQTQDYLIALMRRSDRQFDYEWAVVARRVREFVERFGKDREPLNVPPEIDPDVYLVVMLGTRSKVLYGRYLRTAHWERVREHALDYWGHRCAICGTWNNLHVHHLTYVNLGRETLDDVVVLCKGCHARKHRKKTGTR